MSHTPVDIAALAAEIREISHNMRSSLTVLQVGAQYLGRSEAEGSEVSAPMLIKIKKINADCERLKTISEQLK